MQKATQGFGAMFRRILLALSVTVLAACGGGANDAPSDTSANTSSATQQSSSGSGTSSTPLVQLPAQAAFAHVTYATTGTANGNGHDNHDHDEERDEAKLSNLVISSGTLAPAFYSSTYSYTALVANSVNTLTVTATARDPGASISINGVAVPSGTTSPAFALNVGANLFSIVVVSVDKSKTKTYTVTVTRAASVANADLYALSVSSGTLDPAFAAGVTSYNVNVANTVSSIQVTATASDTLAKLSINGVPTNSGTPSGAINLNVGVNVITIVVTAADNTTTKTYTISVTRAAAANADLSALSLSSGTLNPTFSAGVTSYTSNVSNGVASLQVTATAADPAAKITINGVATASGTPSAAINLNIGVNTLTVVVTAADNVTSKTYSVAVTRAAANNADLSALSLSQGVLNPTFAANVLNYTADVANTVSSIQLTATTADPQAKLAINGVVTASGTASAPITLNVGSNVISIAVTAADNVTTRNYSVTVTRAASANADLNSLSVSSGTLDPVFAKTTANYIVNVPNSVASIQITAVTADANAKLTIHGVATASGTPSAAIALNVGTNLVNVVVTAQDNTTVKTYTVSITRAANGNADLSQLSLSSGTLNPVFASGTTSYSAVVDNAIGSITVTATAADSGASIMINGQVVASGASSAPINLNVGDNTVNIIVTAADTVTSKAYSVSVTRSASSNANLTNLVLSANALTPGFSASTTAYTATVPFTTTSTTVTPTVSDTNATVTVNGVTVASGTASAAINLVVGDNPIAVVITAADKTTSKTYSITVKRQATAELSALLLSNAALVPAFDANTLNYTATVPSAISTITVTPTALDTNSTIRVNGINVVSGTASVPFALIPGANLLVVGVTGADGVTTRNYNIIVTRTADVTLNGLSLSVGRLSPAFDVNTTNYTANVGFLASVVRVTANVADSASSITINGQLLTTGVASAPIHLTPGVNAIDVVVTASDGTTTQTYHIDMTRQNLNSFVQDAYAKSSNSDTSDNFGYAVAAYGNTIVVGAVNESSAASGVNGNQTSNTLGASGAVYVFVKDNNGIWSQQAYIKASNPDLNDQFGSALALWKDTLVVGAINEDSAATGVNGDQTNNQAVDSGAAYVFVRDGAGNWTQQAYLKPSNTNTGTATAADYFGSAVAIHENTIVVGAYWEDSNGVGVNGSQTNLTAAQSGAAYVFVRDTGGNWSQQAYLKATNTQSSDNFGWSVAVFGDTVAVGALGEDSAASGVNGNQADNSKINTGAVYLYQRDPTTGTWAATNYLKASNPDNTDQFGHSVSLWEDTLAVGAPGEASNATGVNGNQADNTLARSGAVYIFRNVDTRWIQEAYIKASNPGSQDSFGYGNGVRLWENTLVVGAYAEDSVAPGINGDQTSNTLTDSGAMYVFIRDSAGVWAQQLYIKAGNPRSFGSFGLSVGYWGDTLGTGAYTEASSNRGLYTTPGSYTSVNSGAAYFFK